MKDHFVSQKRTFFEAMQLFGTAQFSTIDEHLFRYAYQRVAELGRPSKVGYGPFKSHMLDRFGADPRITKLSRTTSTCGSKNKYPIYFVDMSKVEKGVYCKHNLEIKNCEHYIAKLFAHGNSHCMKPYCTRYEKCVDDISECDYTESEEYQAALLLGDDMMALKRKIGHLEKELSEKDVKLSIWKGAKTKNINQAIIDRAREYKRSLNSLRDQLYASDHKCAMLEIEIDNLRKELANGGKPRQGIDDDSKGMCETRGL